MININKYEAIIFMNGTSYCDMHGDRLLYMPVFTAVSIHVKKHVLAQNIQAPNYFCQNMSLIPVRLIVQKTAVYTITCLYTIKNPVSVHTILWLNSHHTAPMFTN
jgi:hypothetical protein